MARSKALTVKAIDAMLTKARDARVEIPDGDARGLYLVLQPSGAASWVFRYRAPIDAKPKKFTIEVLEAMSLADARLAADDLRRKVRQGIDPAEDRRAQRARAADTSRLVSSLLDDFLREHVAKLRAGTAQLMGNQVEAELRPAWGQRQIESITRSDVRQLIAPILERGAPVQANRVFSLVRLFLGWCCQEKELIEGNPADGMKRPAEEAARERVLSSDEIRWLWRGSNSLGNFGICVRLLLLTGQRRMEVGAMEWRELELDSNLPFWTIPARRTKNGHEHGVPLPAAAVEAIQGVVAIKGCPYVFSTNGEVPSSGWSKNKAALDRAMLAEARREAGEAGRGPIEAIEPWSLHDLRRTCATGLAALRHPPHVIEALLNHRSGVIRGVARTYNRFAYIDEKSIALADWARHVSDLVK